MLDPKQDRFLTGPALFYRSRYRSVRGLAAACRQRCAAWIPRSLCELIHASRHA